VSTSQPAAADAAPVGRKALTQDLGGGASAPMFQSSPMWEDLGGFKEPSSPDQDIGGRTFGELMGDIGRPIGTGIGNVVGGIAGAVTGISISQATTLAPVWNPHGHFMWNIGFNTTGRNGWLIQEIASTRRAQDAAGAALPDGLTPRYFEAWAVDGAGVITPSAGGTHDFWQRRSFGAGSQGHWSIRAKVWFTQTDPATQGFAVGNAPEAGGLLSSTAEPAGLGVARLHRYAQGTWDSTTAAPTHTGSANS
jgi:hypothetical protein